MKIAGAEIFNLERGIAQEFLEVYKDVVPEFQAMAHQLCEGPCLVLAIEGKNMVVQTLRKICGPHDS